MPINKVEICGVDTSKLPVLKNDRMRELLPRIHSGDKLARDEFITGNLRLVLSIIQRFSARGENADDLFQVGCIGLMKAIDNFDTTRDVRFSTYAVPMKVWGRKTGGRRGNGETRERRNEGTEKRGNGETVLSFRKKKEPKKTSWGMGLFGGIGTPPP